MGMVENGARVGMGLSGDDVSAMIIAALLAGPGAALRLAPTHLTGTGSSIETALTLPAGVTLVDAEKYRIDGIIRLNAHGGGRPSIARVAIVGMVLVYASSGPSWSVDDPGNVVATTGTDAGAFHVTDFLARGGDDFVPSELPTIGSSAGALTVAVTLLNGASADIEFDGLLARQGPSGAP